MTTVYTVKKLGARGRPKRFWEFWDAIRYANKQNRRGIPVYLTRQGPPTIFLPRKGEKSE